MEPPSTRVEEAVPWRPGAVELLASLRGAGVPCGLVTMSYERFVAPILRHLPAETFRVVVTGEQVSAGKPHPEGYLRGAELLGVEPSRCLVVEDAEVGVTAGRAAGATVAALKGVDGDLAIRDLHELAGLLAL